MFRTKSKTEQAREAVAARVETAASTASDASSSAHSTAADLRARAAELKDKAAPKVESARETARDYAAEAGPKVHDAKDTFVEEVVPKLATALATVLAGAAATKAAAAEAAERAPDAYHVLKGDAVVKQKKGGKGLLLLGLLAAGAAALAWKKSTEKKDPWATAGAYTAPGSGRDSSVGGAHSGTNGATVGEKVTDLATAAKEKAAAAGSAVKDKATEVKDKATDKASEAKDAAADKAADVKDKAGDKTDEFTADDAAEYSGEPTTETVTEGDAWTDAGEWADGSAPSTSGTSEGSDLSTPHLDEGRGNNS
ncbi:hypothetical protein [Knoellia aerolata]|uniref:Mucin n=1 Tax=Knoellia aerolata DSM 18566 TaxID=1385519 RepID=A0A0A0JY71_9MICO|nr:hypothetical protein [Knoellia aerolata]KGN41684.1 hypothetical protein N801_06565 [Knoellia aerolata DSM 18566]